MKIEVVNKTGKKIDESFVRKILEKTLEVSGKKMKSVSFSIVFVGEKEIQLLNRAYRKKNKPTDILSFNYSSEYNKRRKRGAIEGLPASLREALLAGELIICPEIVAKSAKQNKASFHKELAFVVSHGVLHLLGMKHGKRMHEMQDKISTNYQSNTNIRMNFLQDHYVKD